MRISLLAATAVLAISSTAGATLTQVTSFGDNPGALDMYEYVPQGLPAGRPLVVVLHGCTQSASSMEAAGWNTLADQYQFAVLYPQQTSANNPVGCFNWAGEYGDTANLVRGQGENQSIMSMIDHEISSHGVDTHQVYITGFSAGAAFTAVMLATWPDRFAAGAILEGVAYRCATSVSGAYSCQNPGVTKTATQWGDLVRAADSGFTGPWPRVQIWEGTADTTVAPANQTELIKQWTDVHGTDQTADATEALGKSSRAAYEANGQVVVEAYTVDSMSHAVSVGAEGGTACPATAGPYFEDHGLCSTLRIAKFFGLIPGGGGGSGGGGGGGGSGGGSGDGTVYVSIVSPSDGDTVTGQLTVVVAAGDDAGISNVELSIDGASVGSDGDAPYQFDWDADAAGAGSHMLVATATDADGKTATATATVTVAGDGAGGGGGNAGDQPGGVNDLPSCSLDAGGHGGRGWAPIAMALAFAIRRRKRRG